MKGKIPVQHTVRKKEKKGVDKHKASVVYYESFARVRRSAKSRPRNDSKKIFEKSKKGIDKESTAWYTV